MIRLFVVIVSIALPVFTPAYSVGKENASVQASTNRALRAGGFLKKTKIIKTDSAIAKKLSTAKSKMKVLRKPADKQTSKTKGPRTIDEAAEYLRKHVSMACPPAVCTEHDGMFYFSGGKSTKAVNDFSSGFAIRKGERAIWTWDKSEKKGK